jgi:hypothetical protein
VLRGPVEAVVHERLPDLGPVVVRRVADVLLRLLISYSLSAPDDPPELVAAVVGALVVDGASAVGRVAGPGTGVRAADVVEGAS